MNRHTPGPWLAYFPNGGASTVPTPIGFVSGPTVVTAGDGKMQGFRPADASLIAAAPDLLEALELFVTEYVQLVDSGDAGFWDAETEEKVIKARAAIRRAAWTPAALAMADVKQ